MRGRGQRGTAQSGKQPSEKIKGEKTRATPQVGPQRATHPTWTEAAGDLELQHRLKCCGGRQEAGEGPDRGGRARGQRTPQWPNSPPHFSLSFLSPKITASPCMDHLFLAVRSGDAAALQRALEAAVAGGDSASASTSATSAAAVEGTCAPQLPFAAVRDGDGSSLLHALAWAPPRALGGAGAAVVRGPVCYFLL